MYCNIEALFVCIIIIIIHAKGNFFREKIVSQHYIRHCVYHYVICKNNKFNDCFFVVFCRPMGELDSSSILEDQPQ